MHVTRGASLGRSAVERREADRGVRVVSPLREVEGDVVRKLFFGRSKSNTTRNPRVPRAAIPNPLDRPAPRIEWEGDEAEPELEPVDPKAFRALLQRERETDEVDLPADAASSEASSAARPTVAPTIPPPRTTPDPAARPSERRSLQSLLPGASAKLTAKEEVLHKLREGFRGLGDVLGGIDEKLRVHNTTSGELSDSVRQLPELMKELPNASRAGVELLGNISQTIEQQGAVTRDLVQRVGELAQRMQQIPLALQRMDERMDQHEQSASQLGTTIREVQDSVVHLQTESSRLHRDALDEFRRAQQADQERFDEARKSDQESIRALADRTAFQSQVMIVLLFLLVVAFAALLWKL